MKPLILLLAIVLAGIAQADEAMPDAMTVQQVIDHYVAARGGRTAWDKVRTMAWAGRMHSVNSPGFGIPFLMELKRPNKTRFELNEPGLRSVRAFDGLQGFSLRETRTGPRLQNFTPEELAYAKDEFACRAP